MILTLRYSTAIQAQGIRFLSVFLYPCTHANTIFYFSHLIEILGHTIDKQELNCALTLVLE